MIQPVRNIRADAVSAMKRREGASSIVELAKISYCKLTPTLRAHAAHNKCGNHFRIQKTKVCISNPYKEFCAWTAIQ